MIEYKEKDARRILEKLGYTTKVIVGKNNITIYVRNKNFYVVGEISLMKGRKYWQTYSGVGIPVKLRGKGVGLYLYKRLIRYGLKRGFMIRSSYSGLRNCNSEAIWKKLCKVFKVEKRHGCYYVVGS